MKKGTFSAILISLIFHIAIFALLYNHKMTPPTSNQTEKLAIKSYLYVKPKEAKKPLSIPVTPNKPVEIVEEKSVLEQEQENMPKQSEVPPEQGPQIEKPLDAQTTAHQKGPKSRSFSSYKSLQSLRKSLDEKVKNQAYSNYSRQKSASILDGQPELIPHSVIKPDAEEIKEQNTIQLSSDIAIRKKDDGTCIIEQDLSNVGIEGHKAVSMFECGESKFDKGFREHMKKVAKKLGK